MMTKAENTLSETRKRFEHLLLSQTGRHQTFDLSHFTWQRVLVSTLLDHWVRLALASDRFGSAGDAQNVSGSRSVRSQLWSS